MKNTNYEFPPNTFFSILLFTFFLGPFSLSNPFSQQSQGETEFYTHAKQLARSVYLVSTLELNGSRHCVNCPTKFLDIYCLFNTF